MAAEIHSLPLEAKGSYFGVMDECTTFAVGW